MLDRLKRLLKPQTADFAAPPVAGEAAASLDGRDLTRGYISPNQRQMAQDRILNVESYRGLYGYDLYRDLLTDWEVFSKLQQRRLAVVAAETEVIAGGPRRVDKKAAEFIENVLAAVRWDHVSAQMHFGVFYGFAVAECVWAADGAYIVPEAIKVRDRRRFAFDGAGRLRLLTQASPFDGELMPDKKFWTFRTGADFDDEPYGVGLAHWLYWPVTFKRGGVRFWLIAAEKFGSPTAAATFPPGTSEADQARLLATLQRIQTDSAVIFPQGVEAKLLEATRAAGVDYAMLCNTMDQAIDKVILSQIAPADSTASKLNVSADEPPAWQRLTKADADLICGSFNDQVARWLTDWNFPGAAYPTVWRRTEPPADLAGRSEIERRVFDLGYRPTLQQIEDEYDGEWEPVPATAPALAAPAAIPGGVPAPDGTEPPEAPEGPNFAAAADDPLVALLADAMGKAGGAAIDPAAIRIAVKAASNRAEMEQKLLAVFQEKGTRNPQFESALALAEFAAQVLGYVDAAEEAR